MLVTPVHLHAPRILVKRDAYNSECIVGDQSSAKSSFLEGLAGLSFPIAGDLCTRFATQIVLCRAPEVEMRIIIIPGPDAQADEEALDALLGFERTLAADQFDSERFQRIFDENGQSVSSHRLSTKLQQMQVSTLRHEQDLKSEYYGTTSGTQLI
ncbi:hypothetical protein BKA66DRAFT_552030 [Pyrenochaeta sp. MPI-SDFR-AT-0127]|nr:hypothetical protein BKA66DRAFT_552030 [Pyrenochaeta sp. MPI-SDFR-AT-0127]